MFLTTTWCAMPTTAPVRACAGVAAVDVAVQEHVLPRHEDVVENDDGIHLLEARAKRMVEMRAAVVDALAADELEARACRWG